MPRQHIPFFALTLLRNIAVSQLYYVRSRYIPLEADILRKIRDAWQQKFEPRVALRLWYSFVLSIPSSPSPTHTTYTVA